MQTKYRPDIDGLRAVAVLAVVAYHAFPAWIPGGFIGVDVFFVISGYLITSIIYGEMVAGEWSLARFYARRVVRIFPALVLVLAACLFAGWHVLLADEYKQLGKHIAAGAGFVANFALWFEAGYFDRASEAKPLLHLWSLGIEEQFYIAWPLLLWGAWSLHRKARSVALGVLVLSTAAALWLVLQDRTQAFYAPWTRAWELMAGALLALHVQRGGRFPVWMQHGATHAVALLVMVLGVLGLNAQDPFPGALALVPVLPAVVLVAPLGQGWVRAFLSSKPMVALGLVSYPWYLWHWPLLSFAHIITAGNTPVAVRWALVAASLVLAVLTYWLLEKPVRRIPRRWSVALLVLVMGFVALLGKNVYDRDGLERIRHRKLIQMDAQVAADFTDFEKTGLITEARCAQPFKFPERDVCLQQDPGKAATAVVLGDSHALHAYWGLAQRLQDQGENLQLRGKGACVPFLGFYSGSKDLFGCQPTVDDTLQSIAQDATVRTVIIVFRGRYLGAQSGADGIAAFEQGLERTLRLFSSAGKKVYYYLPVVEPGFDPRLCVGSLPLGRAAPRPCTIDQAEDSGKVMVLADVTERVVRRFPGTVVLVDPNTALCQQGRCDILQQGHSVFKDDNHLSYFGSMLVGQTLPLVP